MADTDNVHKCTDVSWIEKQLHQQYAENYNHISGYVLSFAIGVAGALAPYVIAFGEVLSDASAANIVRLCAADVLCVSALMAIGYLCIKQGWATRRDQFIIFAIRARHFGTPDNMFVGKGPHGIFPDEYYPFYKSAPRRSDKPKSGYKDFPSELKYRPINILIGAFKYLLKVSCCCILALSIITIAAIGFAIWANHTDGICCWLLLFPIIGFIVPFLCFAWWLRKVNREYIDMEIDYKDYCHTYKPKHNKSKNRTKNKSKQKKQNKSNNKLKIKVK